MKRRQIAVGIFLWFTISIVLSTGTFSEPNPIEGTLPKGYQTVSAGGVTFSFMNDAQNLYGILKAETTGWLSVGFAPQDRMQGANMIIGYVEDGKAVVRDDFGTGRSSHDSDENLKWQNGDKLNPGINNVTSVSGEETSNPKRTRITFTIPLNSGDPFDRILVPGEKYKIILAKGSSDDIVKKHTERGTAEITLVKIPPKKSGIAK